MDRINCPLQAVISAISNPNLLIVNQIEDRANTKILREIFIKNKYILPAELRRSKGREKSCSDVCRAVSINNVV